MKGGENHPFFFHKFYENIIRRWGLSIEIIYLTNHNDYAITESQRHAQREMLWKTSTNCLL